MAPSRPSMFLATYPSPVWLRMLMLLSIASFGASTAYQSFMLYPARLRSTDRSARCSRNGQGDPFMAYGHPKLYSMPTLIDWLLVCNAGNSAGRV